MCKLRQISIIKHELSIIKHHFEIYDVSLQQKKILMVKVLWLINLFLN